MRYPQSLFTRKLKAHIPINARVIIDAPCGNGQTTYELAQFFPNSQLIGVDTCSKSISNAKKHFQLSNNEFKKDDIHNFVENNDHFEYFCLINSLFLLEKPQKLLEQIKDKLTNKGRLLLILPNPNSTNFKRYQNIFPDINSFILERKEYGFFFAKVGLKILFCEGLARIPFYGRKDTKILYPIRDRYLFYLENRSKSEDYGYFLIVLKKER